jgi:hypothetical protein
MKPETIYETQAQRDLRIEAESRAFERKKQRSRNSARNRSVRAEVMARASQACEICRFNFYSSLVVHHIIPVAAGGSARPANLIVLCPNCHSLVHHYSHHRRPERHESWCAGLMSCGLTEPQARTLILVASREAAVLETGVIVPWENTSLSTRYVLIDEPQTAGAN